MFSGHLRQNNGLLRHRLLLLLLLFIFPDPNPFFYFGADAPSIFALVIFLCDGYLVFKKEEFVDPEDQRREAFLRIMVRLPLDLQEVVCNRVVGEASDIIGSSKKELGFRAVAKAMTKGEKTEDPSSRSLVGRLRSIFRRSSSS